MNVIVYRIVIGPVAYVGTTTQLHRRLAEHMSALKMGSHHCHELQAAYSGIAGVRIDLLEEAPAAERDEREAYWRKVSLAVSAEPASVVKLTRRHAVLDAVKRGLTYREIAARYGVSLGFITNLKRHAA